MSQIFISYAKDDEDLARRLFDDLVEVGYHPPFLAVNMGGGEEWEKEVIANLHSCRYVLVVHTAAWLNKRYPLAEYVAAVSLKKNVRILLHDAEACFRDHIHYLDFRPEIDRKSAMERLVASLYTVRPHQSKDSEPYKGLHPYRSTDSDVFHGRKKDIERLSEFVGGLRSEHQLGVIFGPSGCGKSSLIGAGLLPLVEGATEWAPVALSAHSTDPFGELAAKLLPLDGSDQEYLTERLTGWSPQSEQPHPLVGLAAGIRRAREQQVGSGVGTRLLIIVDQFEQCLLSDVDGLDGPGNTNADAGGLLPFLLAGCESEDIDRPVVVIAIRTDHLATLDSAINAVSDRSYGQYAVGRLTRGGLEEAIREPAIWAGVQVEETLVSDLADQVNDADGLPLLSFALQTLYREGGGTMTATAYEKLGRFEHLVDKEADRLHARAITNGYLKPADKVLFDRLLITMASPSGEDAWIRRPLPVSEIPKQLRAAFQHFVDGRIFSSDATGHDMQPVIQPAHDMVLTHWDHLANLLKRHRTETGLRDRINRTKADENRLAGVMLDQSIELLGNKTIPLSKDTRKFIRWAKWRRRVLRAALGLVAVAMTVLAVAAFAFALQRDAALSDAEADRDRAETAQAAEAEAAELADERRAEAESQTVEAERQRAEAERQRTEAEAAGLTVAATLARVDNPALAAGLAIEAIATGAGTEAGRRQLLYDAYEAMDRTGQPYAPMTGHDASVWALAFQPEEQRLVTGGDDGTVRFWDWVSNEPAGDGIELGAGIRALAFTDDPTTLAVAGLRPQVAIWNMVDDEVIIVEHERGAVLAVTFSPDGSILASGGGDGLVRLWSPAGASLGELEGHEDGLIAALAFSPDGSMLASSDYDGRVFLWDVTEREAITRLEGPHRTGATVSGLAWSTDGTKLATAGDDELVVIWTIDDDTEPLELRGHTNTVVAVDFAEDDRTLVTAGNDQTVRLWDAESGAELHVLRGHEGWVRAVGFSPDGDRIASVSTDQTVRTWRAGRGDAIGVRIGHRGWVFGLAALDGGRLASGGGDGRLRIWSAAGELIEELEPRTTAAGGPAGLRRLTASASGSFLAVPGNDGLVEVYSARTLDPVSSFVEHAGFVYATAFAPDGARVASAGDDEVVRIWETTSGTPLDTFTDADDPIYGLAWSPDGRLVAAADADGAVWIWREDGARIATLTNHLGVAWDVAWAPGETRQLASAGADGTIRLWAPSGDGDSATGDSVGSVWAEVAELSDHRGAVLSVDYSSDGQWLVSTSDDGTIRVWDVEAEALHLTLNGHTETTWDAIFIDHDQVVLSTGDDSTIRSTPLLPEVVPGEPVPLCSEVSRFVTSAQVMDSLPRLRPLQGCTDLD